MATYLVLRSHYNTPSEKALVKFEDDETVLAWFQNRWQQHAEAGTNGTSSYDLLAEEIGFSVYGLASIFDHAGEENLASPKNDRTLKEYVAKHLYTEMTADYRPHFLQVCTDDDELELCYFIFDDHFLKTNSSSMAFLMHDDWKLPTEFADPTDTQPANTIFKHKRNIKPRQAKPFAKSDNKQGKVYFAISECIDSANLDPIAPIVFSGLRLPDFPRLLFAKTPDESWSKEVNLLRSMMFFGREKLSKTERPFVDLIHNDPANPDHWNVYSDWLHEQQRPPLHVTFLQRAFEGIRRISPGYFDQEFGQTAWPEPEKEAEELVKKSPSNGPEKTRVAVSEHLAQACLFYARWEFRKTGKELHHQWWLFDDCWANANKDLADGLLRFCVDWRAK